MTNQGDEGQYQRNTSTHHTNTIQKSNKYILSHQDSTTYFIKTVLLTLPSKYY